MIHSFVKRILAGELIWSLAGNFFVQALNFVTFLFLARILGPGPYGIFGLAAVALAFAWSVLVDGGSEYLVRAPSITHGHANASFWPQLGLALVLGVTMAIGLRHLALAAGEAELARLVSWLSAVPVLYALTGTQRALLQRALRFRVLAGCSFASALLGGGVGIAAALHGAGAMSLALMMLGQSGSLAVLLWGFAGWSPTLAFHRGELRDVLTFGAHMTSAQLASLAELQGSRLVIGVTAGPVGLGLFTMGWRVVEVISTLLLTPVTQVAAPALAALQHDRAAFARRLAGFMRLTMVLALPAYAGLAVTAPIMVPALFGPQWNEAIVPLQILCLLGVGWAASFPLNAALVSTGLMAERTRVSLLGLGVVVLGSGTAAILGLGVPAMAAVMVIRQAIVLPAFALPLARRGYLETRALAGDVARIALSTGLMLTAVLTVSHEVPLSGQPAVVLAVATGAASYAAAILLLARAAALDALRMLLPVRPLAAAGHRPHAVGGKAGATA